VGSWFATAWERARWERARWLRGGVALQEPGALIADGMPEGAATGCRRESEYGPRGAHACGTWQVDVLVAEVEKQIAGKAKKGGDKPAKDGAKEGGKKKKGGKLDKDYCLRFSAYGPGPVPSELCGRCAAARRAGG
jgi:hypothetical protein